MAKGLVKKIKDLILVGIAGLSLYSCPIPIENFLKEKNNIKAQLKVTPSFGRAPLEIKIELGTNSLLTGEEKIDYEIEIDIGDDGVIDDYFYSSTPMVGLDDSVGYTLEQEGKVRIYGRCSDLEKGLTNQKSVLINVDEEYNYTPPKKNKTDNENNKEKSSEDKKTKTQNIKNIDYKEKIIKNIDKIIREDQIKHSDMNRYWDYYNNYSLSGSNVYKDLNNSISLI